MDFLKGLTRFQQLDLKRVASGVVLYNGEQRMGIRGIRIFNPFHAEDIWEILTSPVEPGNS